MKNLTETNAELKAYIAGLKEKENRNKLVGLVIAGSVIIALLVAGIVYLIKKRCDEECYDDWLSCDGNLREALEFSVDDTIDIIRDNEVKKERNKDAR